MSRPRNKQAQALADGQLLYGDSAAAVPRVQPHPPAMVAGAAVAKGRGARTHTNTGGGRRPAPAKHIEATVAATPREALAVLSRREYGHADGVAGGALQPPGEDGHGRAKNQRKGGCGKPSVGNRRRLSPAATGNPPMSRWQQTASSTGTATRTTAGGGTVSGMRSRFVVEDAAGTRQAIAHEWKEGIKTKDVLSACARINAFLDNPLLTSDEDRAAVTLQSATRGWLLRRARKAGALLFPVEAQALEDGRLLMSNGYGARVYSLGPSERRVLVKEHLAAKKLQRAWFLHRSPSGSSLQNEDSCIFVGPEDSLLNVPGHAILSELGCSEKQAGSAAEVLQRAFRVHAAIKRCLRIRLRLSKAVNFLRFLSTDLAAATITDAARIKNAAAVRIQSIWRSARCRRGLIDNRGFRAGAALVLQKHVRGWSSRRKMGKLLEKLLLKRVLRWWNKIMWTVYSPGKGGGEETAEHGPRFFGEAGSRQGSVAAENGLLNTRVPVISAAVEGLPVAMQTSGHLNSPRGDDEDGGRHRSLWVQGEEEGDVVLGAQETPRLAAQEAPRQSWQVVEGSNAGAEPDWQAAGREALLQRAGAALTEAQAADQARRVHDPAGIPPTGAERLESAAVLGGNVPRLSVQPDWPDNYSKSICMEAGALKQAMVTDSSAVCIQRAVRAYMIRTVVAARLPALAAKRKEGRPMRGQLVAQPAVRHDGAASCSAAAPHVHARHAESSAAALSAAQAETDREAACGSSHVTPPPGGQAFFGGAACTPGGGWTKADGGNLIGLPPTPYRAGRSPPPGSFASPVRRTPPGGGSGLPPMTPVAQGSRGPDAAEPLREQVLTAWKKGIEDQVSLIHEKLIDSARKGSARSRSRSPAPGGGDEVKQLCFQGAGASQSPIRSVATSPDRETAACSLMFGERERAAAEDQTLPGAGLCAQAGADTGTQTRPAAAPGATAHLSLALSAPRGSPSEASTVRRIASRGGSARDRLASTGAGSGTRERTLTGGAAAAVGGAAPATPAATAAEHLTAPIRRTRGPSGRASDFAMAALPTLPSPS